MVLFRTQNTQPKKKQNIGVHVSSNFLQKSSSFYCFQFMDFYAAEEKSGSLLTLVSGNEKHHQSHLG